MNWKDFSIFKKLLIGFGFVLMLLTASGLLSINGIKNILARVEVLKDNNNIKQLLTEKEVDHLNWAQNLNALFTNDQVNELNVETDDHKCGLGMWLYGSGLQQAKELVPEMTPYLKQVETTHAELHASATAIKEVFRQADVNLPFKILEIDKGHHVWAGKIRDAIINEAGILENVQFDPEKCQLGMFLSSDIGKQAYTNGDAEFKEAWDAIAKSHGPMHESAKGINAALAENNFERAKGIFQTTTLPNLKKTLSNLTQLHDNALQRLTGKEKALEIFNARTVPSLQEVQGLLDKLRQVTDKKIEILDKDLLRSFHSIRNKIVLTFAVSIAIGLFLAFNVARVTSGPIARVVKLAQTMAEGDLTHSIDFARKDEVGVLVSSLNQMSANIRAIINNIHTDSNHVAVSSEELSAASNQLATASEEMTNQSSKVAAATEQISVNMNNVTLTVTDMSAKADSVATLAGSMSGNVNSVAAAIEEMTSSIREVAVNCGKAAEHAGKASEISGAAILQAGELNKSSRDIGNIISIINQVTEQTKLLALNATIEAARAGESGKGFAVVAGEVKELAKQTADATAKIAVQIKEMQGKTGFIVQSINTIAEVNNQADEITSSIAASVEQQSATASDIAMIVADTSKESSSVSATIKELSRNIEQDILSSLKEVAAGVAEVARNIQGVDSVSLETARSAGVINAAAKELAGLANRLLGQVNKFKV